METPAGAFLAGKGTPVRGAAEHRLPSERPPEPSLVPKEGIFPG
jgi:hypothetical protein